MELKREWGLEQRPENGVKNKNINKPHIPSILTLRLKVQSCLEKPLKTENPMVEEKSTMNEWNTTVLANKKIKNKN